MNLQPLFGDGGDFHPTFSMKTQATPAQNFILLVFGLLAIATFHVAVNLASSNFNNQRKEEDTTVISSIKLVNSAASMHHSSKSYSCYKDSPINCFRKSQYLFALNGSYLCLIRKISPQLARPLIFLSIPSLFIAAAVGKKVVSDATMLIHTTNCKKESLCVLFENVLYLLNKAILLEKIWWLFHFCLYEYIKLSKPILLPLEWQDYVIQLNKGILIYSCSISRILGFLFVAAILFSCASTYASP